MRKRSFEPLRREPTPKRLSPPSLVDELSDPSCATPDTGPVHHFSSLSILPQVPESQAKLEVSEPGDPAEHEADRVADRVVQMTGPEQTRNTDDERENEQDRPRAEAPPQGLSARTLSGSAAGTGAGGAPLDRPTKAFMESRFGFDFSHVRVHVDPMAARSVHARAFTLGDDIVFDANRYAPQTSDGRWLLAHELAHVAANPSSNTIQRKPNDSPPPSNARERVVGQREVAERNRTVAKIEIVGHASPRWRGARTAKIADEKNWQLAEERAEMTRMEVESLLAQLLPDNQLVFEYRFKRASETEPKDPVKALDEPADVTLDVEGRGSTETLGEAGARGRQANDDPMRRVEVKVTLHSETETDVAEDTERTERKPGATRNWSIWVTGEAGVEAVGKAAAILVQLKNDRGETGTYAGWISGFGASVGVSIAKTSPPDFEEFTTPEPMNFSDFSGGTFAIASFGFGVGAFGAEWSRLKFQHFLGGQKTPGPIQIGGISFGGIELNLGNVVYGTMFLTDNPPETYDETTRTTNVQTFESLSQEDSSHRVLFATGSSDVTAWASDMLNEYLFGVVTRSGL